MAGANASATTTNENLECRFQTLGDDFHINNFFEPVFCVHREL